MKVPNHFERGDVGFNMTPMIDVVFLLIIFFLVSSHLAKQEVHLDLPLPVADSGSEAMDEPSRRVTINVLRNGQLQFSGRLVPAEELVGRLTQALKDHGKDVEVRIRSDRRAPYGDVDPILLSCARVGIWNVTFSVYRSEDVR